MRTPKSEPIERARPEANTDWVEYILVTDRDSKVMKSGTYQECKTLANLVRKAGGEVTVFKATKG